MIHKFYPYNEELKKWSQDFIYNLEMRIPYFVTDITVLIFMPIIAM